MQDKNHVFEGKWMLKLFYCMASRQNVPLFCLTLSPYFIFSAVYLGASKIKVVYPGEIGSWDEVWVKSEVWNRDVEGRVCGGLEKHSWVHWVLLVLSCWAVLNTVQGHPWPHKLFPQCPDPVALSMKKKVLAVRLGAACLMARSCSSI